MNVPRADRQRYWLAYFFDDLNPGDQFKPGLLHITIITWFVVDIEETILLESFEKKFNKQKAFDIKIGARTDFGPKNEVSVNLIKPSDAIINLHKLSMNWFETIGARWAVKNPHAGNDYTPHIRRRQGTKLADGQMVKIDSLCLIKARRREDSIRAVAAKVVLDG